jgi:protein-arginine kinase activator protein McsA
VELVNLEQWREEILRREAAAAAARPKSRLQRLRQKLEQAVAAEEFEEAARFRDEIRRLTETADPG